MYLNNPITIWYNMPSFLIGEMLIIIIAYFNFIHSYKNGIFYIKLWLSSIITGIINDNFFMLLPLSNTFWQAQATIMITERMPLYIPCIYNILLYTSTISSINFKLNKLSKAIISSYIGAIIYAIYDYIGAKYLWWTWHTTDATVLYRWYGVPYGSTCWTLVYIFVFSFLTQMYNYFLITILFTTPLMMCLMGLFQLPFNDIGISNHITLIFILVISFIILMKNINKYSKNIVKNVQYNNYIYNSIIAYFIIMICIILFYDSSNHLSYGLHQCFSFNNTTSNDMFGYKRNKCISLNDNFVSYMLTEIPENNTNIYIVKGIL